MRLNILAQIDPHGLGQPLGLAGLGAFIAWCVGAISVLFGAAGAIMVFTYYTLSVWETPTVQRFVSKWAAKRAAKKLAELTKRQADLTAEFQALGVLTRATSITQPDIAGGATHTTTVETKSPS